MNLRNWRARRREKHLPVTSPGAGIERREQFGSAVALVVMSALLGLPEADRQHRLGAV